jgi:hypothetical protein
MYVQIYDNVHIMLYDEQKVGVSHYDLAIYIKKYLKAKEEIMETQIFHHAKI